MKEKMFKKVLAQKIAKMAKNHEKSIKKTI